MGMGTGAHSVTQIQTTGGGGGSGGVVFAQSQASGTNIGNMVSSGLVAVNDGLGSITLNGTIDTSAADKNIVGLFGRIAAFGILSNMVVATIMVHAQFGLFMNWAGNQKGEGFEYHLLAIALAAAVVIQGSGALSIDWLLDRKLNATTKQ